MMTEEQLQNLLLLLHRPIWDPIPWWIKLNPEQVIEFNEVQVRLNTKLAEIQAEKVQALSRIAGMARG